MNSEEDNEGSRRFSSEGKSLTKMNFVGWVLTKYQELSSDPQNRYKSKLLEKYSELIVATLLGAYENEATNNVEHLVRNALDHILTHLPGQNQHQEMQDAFLIWHFVEEFIIRIVHWKEQREMQREQDRKNFFIKGAFHKTYQPSPPVMITSIPADLLDDEKPLVVVNRKRSSTESITGGSSGMFGSPRSSLFGWGEARMMGRGKATTTSSASSSETNKEKQKPEAQKQNSRKELEKSIIVLEKPIKPIKQEVIELDDEEGNVGGGGGGGESNGQKEAEAKEEETSEKNVAHLEEEEGKRGEEEANTEEKEREDEKNEEKEADDGEVREEEKEEEEKEEEEEDPYLRRTFGRKSLFCADDDDDETEGKKVEEKKKNEERKKREVNKKKDEGKCSEKERKADEEEQQEQQVLKEVKQEQQEEDKEEPGQGEGDRIIGGENEKGSEKQANDLEEEVEEEGYQDEETEGEADDQKEGEEEIDQNEGTEGRTNEEEEEGEVEENHCPDGEVGDEPPVDIEETQGQIGGVPEGCNQQQFEDEYEEEDEDDEEEDEDEDEEEQADYREESPSSSDSSQVQRQPKQEPEKAKITRPYSPRKTCHPSSIENEDPENNRIAGILSANRKRRLEEEIGGFESYSVVDCKNIRLSYPSNEPVSEFDDLCASQPSSSSALDHDGGQRKYSSKVKIRKRKDYEAEQIVKRRLARVGKAVRFNEKIKKKTFQIDPKHNITRGLTRQQKNPYFFPPVTTKFLKTQKTPKKERPNVSNNKRKIATQVANEVREIVGGVEKRQREVQQQNTAQSEGKQIDPRERLIRLSRLLLTDSVLERMDEQVMRNMMVARSLEHPKNMAIFLNNGLETNTEFLTNPARVAYFEFSYIFVVYGFDQITREYGIPMAEDFLGKLREWFRTNLPYSEDNKLMRGENEEDTSYYYSPPQIVAVTLPEVGQRVSDIKDFNQQLRQFVEKDRHENVGICADSFVLLDWALLVNNQQQSASELSEEDRVRLLVMEMRHEFGVLIK